VITRHAPAKVNLTLEVTGKRSDGFHEVVSIAQTISLHDTLTFEPAEDVALAVDNPALAAPDNLVLRAASLLRAHASGTPGARISLQKRIPLAAGLGGGSSDAAATLVALNDMWRVRLAPEELLRLASRLGSDVPFLVRGGTAFLSGRGEVVTGLPDAPARWLVLLCPDFPIAQKTGTMYRRLASVEWDTGETTRAAREELLAGRFPPERMLVNTFSRVADDVFPGLPALRARLRAAAAGRPVHLSGAGPTVFCLFEEQEEAHTAFRELREEGLPVYLARTVGRRPHGEDATVE
jgi:4-diphosphocytidyl-2-C-methyl-D-erythritol kinase